MGTVAGDVTLRPLASPADYADCVEVQKETWGHGFEELVPPVVLKISQLVGGVAAGAFAPGDGGPGTGRLLGFVYGLTGLRGGRLVHWSHMLAVRREARDLGLGRAMKLYQRDELLALGVEQVLWTYDPLEARNAHLNFNRLGVEVEEYVEEMYVDPRGGEMGSELARGIGTDRFIVRWEIAGARAAKALAGEPPDFAPFLAAPACDPLADAPLPAAARVRVPIPARIQETKREDLRQGAAWRVGTRRALQSYLARGYRVAAFAGGAAEALGYYGLERPE